MIAALEAQKCKVIVTTAGGMGRACGAFLDDVMAGRISHSDQPQLNSAVEGARKRPIRDAGLFGWDRRDGTVVVAPLVAVTLAVTAQRPRAAAEAEGPALHSEEDLPGRGLLSLEVRAGWAAQTVSLFQIVRPRVAGAVSSTETCAGPHRARRIEKGLPSMNLEDNAGVSDVVRLLPVIFECHGVH